MSTPGLPALDPETAADAVEVLRILPAWRLAPERWQRIERILEAIAEALAAGDLPGFRAATSELDLASPIRVRRIGATSEGMPAPEPILDRTNHLVHVLGGTPPPSPVRRPVDAPEPRGGEDHRRAD